MKVMLVLAPVVLVAMVYALAQGDFWAAGLLAFIEVLMFLGYRAEKRRLERQP